MTTKLKKYSKVRPLGHTETVGILQGTVEVSEKIDGANVRITRKDNELVIGGRNHSQGFFGQEFLEGFGSWVKENEEALHAVFDSLPGSFVLIGEWTRKHAIYYGEINDKPRVIFYDVLAVTDWPEEAEICTAEFREFVFATLQLAGLQVNPVTLLENPSVEELMELAEAQSHYGAVTREGIVIKNDQYRNQYGRQCHAKLLSSRFRETKDKKDGNARSAAKASRYDYRNLIDELVTPVRLQKLLDANNAEPDMKHMEWLSKTMPDDVLLEHITDIRDAVDVLDFKLFQKQVCAATVKLLNDAMVQRV